MPSTFEEQHGPDPMLAAMDKMGITPSLLARKLKKELNAKETKVFHKEGEIFYSKGLIAWDVRQRARMDAQKLMGLYPTERISMDVTTQPELSDDERQLLKEVTTEIARRRLVQPE